MTQNTDSNLEDQRKSSLGESRAQSEGSGVKKISQLTDNNYNSPFSSTIGSNDSWLNSDGTGKRSLSTAATEPSLGLGLSLHLGLKPATRPQYAHSNSSFPLVANSSSNHLFTLLPSPNVSATQQLALMPYKPQSYSAVNSDGTVSDTMSNAKVVATGMSNEFTNSNEYLNRTHDGDHDNASSHMKSSSGSKHNSRATLRYNWSDYEDRLLLKTVLSNHRILRELQNKPLKKFWELILDMIKHHLVNAKVSRTHRQCRERFYILYNKLMKFAEQLGVDPSTEPRRANQGLSFTELEELFIKTLELLSLEDGFRLVVNNKFYEDQRAVDDFERSVAVSTQHPSEVQDESTKRKRSSNEEDDTLSLGSSKSSDSKDKVINNVLASKHKITPLSFLNRGEGSAQNFSSNSRLDDGYLPLFPKHQPGANDSVKRAKYDVTSSGSASGSGAENMKLGSNLMESDQARNSTSLNTDELVATPPIMRQDSKSYSSLSSSNVSYRGDGTSKKPGTFLKNKKSKSKYSLSDANAGGASGTGDDKSSIGIKTNVDESSNSSLVSTSSSASQGESNGENENDDSTSLRHKSKKVGGSANKDSVDAYLKDLESDDYEEDDEESEEPVAADSIDQERLKRGQKLHGSSHSSEIGSSSMTKLLDKLNRRMDNIDTSLSDLKTTIKQLDSQMKDGLYDLFERISKYQSGMNENINMVIAELRLRNQQIEKEITEKSLPEVEEKHMLEKSKENTVDLGNDIEELREKLDGKIEDAKEKLIHSQDQE